MKENIKLLLKGALIGVANIIPGVSGGTMAISLGLYEKIISIIADFKRNIRKNILFLLPIILGAAISLMFFSHVINFALEKYEVITIFVFAGLIIGGIPIVYKKIEKKMSYKSIIPFVLVMILAISLSFIKTGGEVSFLNMGFMQYVFLIIVGIIAAITMVVPGISGSLILMLIGYYKPIIQVVKELTSFQNILSNLLIVSLVGIGVLIGILSSAKLIKKSLAKYKNQTYSAILGFVISSIALMFLSIDFNISITEILIGLILMFLGAFLTYKLEK